MDEAIRCHPAEATTTGPAIPLNPSALSWTHLSPAGMPTGWDGMGRDSGPELVGRSVLGPDPDWGAVAQVVLVRVQA
jgi:hypothetical protein